MRVASAVMLTDVVYYDSLICYFVDDVAVYLISNISVFKLGVRGDLNTVNLHVVNL